MYREEIKENVVLNYIEPQRTDENENGEVEVLVYELSFDFHDSHYMVYVMKEDLEKSYFSCNFEGDGDLFSSFEDFCDDNWDLIKDKCQKYSEHFKEFYGEDY